MQARTCSPTHQQSQSVGFSPFGSSCCALYVPASLFDRLPQALAHRRLCPAEAGQFLFLREGKKNLVCLGKVFLIRDFLRKIF